VDVDADLRIIPGQHVSLTWTGDEAVLVDASTGQVHVVNATAARAWELCRSGQATTVGSLRTAIAAEYEVPESEVEADLLSLLETFRTLDLIELTPSS
jgi:PqqD family protein of HPr-rel-A system